jgi:hypothetical protein
MGNPSTTCPAPGYTLGDNIDAIKVDAKRQTHKSGFSLIVRPDGTNADFPKQRTFESARTRRLEDGANS